MARQLEIPPKLFAFTTVWLAGTASLLLPVSNLTNLLALHRFDQLGLGLGDYLGLSWRPAIAAILITVSCWPSSSTATCAGRTSYRRLLRSTTRSCSGDRPGSALRSVPPSSPASRSRSRRASARSPWSCCSPCADAPSSAGRSSPGELVVTVVGLFLVVGALTAHGLEDLLGSIAGTHGQGLLADLRLTGTAAAGANVVDNLPAYLAMEPVAAANGSRMMLLLIGVNCGCLLTLWGSLATLLWRDRCVAAGVHISWWSFLWRGLVLTPVVLIGTVLALSLA